MTTSSRPKDKSKNYSTYCRWQGEEEYADPLITTCPYCMAPPGEFCYYWTEDRKRIQYSKSESSHSSRWRRAQGVEIARLRKELKE
jgi:hypothetical protein